MMNPRVQLRSGGYVIINSTEALVAIDVNSGRATRERNIEETALRTNFEAAEEVARQLRLRDLAGLIVIDFIDMEEHRNNRSVERRLKECLRADRARIQVGRISHFGLLEMSRQRLRPSLIEISSHACPTCHGSGVVRSTESSALVALRALEHEGINGSVRDVTVALPAAVGRYLLNQKRAALVAIEQRYGLQILIVEDDTLVPPELRMERGKEPRSIVPQPAVETRAEADPDEAIDDAVVDEEISAEEPDVPVEHVPAESRPAEPAPESRGEGDRSRRRRRRGRRGGRRRRQEEQFGVSEAREPVSEAFERESQVGPLEHVPLSPEDIDPTLTYETSAQPQAREASDASPGAEGGGRRRRRRRRRRRGGGNGPRPDVGAIEGGRQELVEHAPQALAPEAPYSPPAEPVPPPVEMVRESRPETAPPEAPPQPQPAAEEPPRERRRGWWNRLTS
jgi:ribonuclease E